jgi:hypothetical protein
LTDDTDVAGPELYLARHGETEAGSIAREWIERSGFVPVAFALEAAV